MALGRSLFLLFCVVVLLLALQLRTTHAAHISTHDDVIITQAAGEQRRAGKNDDCSPCSPSPSPSPSLSSAGGAAATVVFSAIGSSHVNNGTAAHEDDGCGRPLVLPVVVGIVALLSLLAIFFLCGRRHVGASLFEQTLRAERYAQVRGMMERRGRKKEGEVRCVCV
jgi:hypothetical protein